MDTKIDIELVPYNQMKAHVLLTSDRREYTVQAKLVYVSKTLKDMVDSLSSDVNKITNDKTPIPLPIHSQTLIKVLDWCTHHINDPPFQEPSKEDDRWLPRSLEIPVWDKKFFSKLSLEEIYDIMKASDYLDINHLSHTCYKYIASLLRAKTSKQICENFKIALPQENVDSEGSFNPERSLPLLDFERPLKRRRVDCNDA